MNERYKELLALLIVVSHNMRVLHWCVRGLDFDPTHAMLGEYYAQFSDYTDEVAEMGMQIGVEPLGIFAAVQTAAKGWGAEMLTGGTQTYTSAECYSIIDAQFSKLLSQYEATYQSVPADIQNRLQEHAQWVRKQLHYKNRHRLM